MTVLQIQNSLDKFWDYHTNQLIFDIFQSAVTRNYSEKSINSILDYISTSKQMDLLQSFYETTLEALKGKKRISCMLEAIGMKVVFL